MPVTGLERVEDTRPHQLSPLQSKNVLPEHDFAGHIAESCFMELGGVVFLLKSLGKSRSEMRGQRHINESILELLCHDSRFRSHGWSIIV
jgi:hypothetical protein